MRDVNIRMISQGASLLNLSVVVAEKDLRHAVESLHTEFFSRTRPGGVRMKIAIVGYGKMGRMIERLAAERGIAVAAKLDEFNNANFEGITRGELSRASMWPSISPLPSTVVGNIERIAALGVNLVVGTTGWQEHMPHVKSVVEQHGIGLVWSPNYSVGVNAFFRIVNAAAKLLANEPEYEAWAWEIHHSAKKDAPSGTLLKLVDEMRAAGYERHVDVASNRAGAIPARTRSDSTRAADTITLRHTARSREGFALGAIKAAEWVAGKKGFHEFGDILFAAEGAKEVAHVYRMRNGDGYARSGKTDRWMKRRCASWCGVRSSRASIFWCPAAPRAKARR